jgi:hypothetical protein
VNADILIMAKNRAGCVSWKNERRTMKTLSKKP